jgi:hypothetical protein
MRKRKLFAVALAASATLAVSSLGTASAERIELGNVVADIDGTFTPKVLPKNEFAPITLTTKGKLQTKDGTVVPQLGNITIDFDRDGKLTTRGLPVCKPSKLENTLTNQALKVCKSALVGRGTTEAIVAFPDDVPFSAKAPLLMFNAPGGNLVFHAYAFVPAPTTFVVPAKVSKAGGPYGTRVDVDVPHIAGDAINGSYGSLVDFNVRVNKKWKHKGQKLSYATARCKDGRLQARANFTFRDGQSFGGTVFRPCKGKG